MENTNLHKQLVLSNAIKGLKVAADMIEKAPNLGCPLFGIPEELRISAEELNTLKLELLDK